MNEEVQTPEVAAEAAAPELEATAAPETEQTSPEEKPAEAAKTFSQEEVDALIGKRLAREQRKWERQQAQQQAPKPVVAEPPAREQYASDEAYVEALAAQKAEALIAQREAQRQQAQMLESYHEREEEARGKYDDFEQVAYNPRVPITEVMAQTIQASDIGPEVAYYLGTNIKEADRIARLPPILQAKEIGKIEVKLSSAPPVQRTTSAPAPISPVTARSSGNPSYDTTDPRSTKTMSTSEWIAAERARQIKKLQSQQLR